MSVLQFLALRLTPAESTITPVRWCIPSLPRQTGLSTLPPHDNGAAKIHFCRANARAIPIFPHHCRNFLSSAVTTKGWKHRQFCQREYQAVTRPEVKQSRYRRRPACNIIPSAACITDLPWQICSERPKQLDRKLQQLEAREVHLRPTEPV